MKERKILLIGMGVCMSDILSGMVLANVSPADFTIVHNYREAEAEIKQRFPEKHINITALKDISEPFMLNDNKPRKERKRYPQQKTIPLNVRPRDIVAFRMHPQMVRRG